ncbi:MAG: hypothetical protein LBB79_10160 [Prevotellaceae bacterium]|jgi:uncharacterized protein YhhL (DUF1145 family)|nr:hypothetical protein [Prevotellaceae bacterium]
MENSVLMQSRLTTVGKLLLGVGSSIIIMALIYMIANVDRADAIVRLWFMAILAGTCLTLLSCLFRNRKTQHRSEKVK